MSFVMSVERRNAVCVLRPHFCRRYPVTSAFIPNEARVYTNTELERCLVQRRKFYEAGYALSALLVRTLIAVTGIRESCRKSQSQSVVQPYESKILSMYTLLSLFSARNSIQRRRFLGPFRRRVAVISSTIPCCSLLHPITHGLAKI